MCNWCCRLFLKKNAIEVLIAFLFCGQLSTQACGFWGFLFILIPSYSWSSSLLNGQNYLAPAYLGIALVTCLSLGVPEQHRSPVAGRASDTPHVTAELI